ncbi:MAG: hypothetical protein ACLFR1_09115 [Spirochaetia bacterium]
MQKRYILIPMFIVFFTGLLWAQDSNSTSRLDTFQRNFARASLQVKIDILEDASEIESENMGPLYLQAANFLLNNSELLRRDNSATRLGIIAIQNIRRLEYTEAVTTLWRLFQVKDSTTFRVEIMNTLSVIGSDNEQLVVDMNAWIETQNNMYQSGTRPDLQVMDAAISALGRIGDQSSFPFVFTVYTLQYSPNVTRAAQQALQDISGDYQENLLEIIDNGQYSEKRSAFRIAMDSSDLTDEEKAEVAEAALRKALNASSSDAESRGVIRQLRYAAAEALIPYGRSQADDAAIAHFDQTVLEYDRGIATKTYLLEAIALLGSTGTAEAAERLTIYLGLINSYTENENPYDEQIVLAVINNLGDLGDPVAFDYLLYTTYLNYSNNVKETAREALDELDW